MCFVCVCVCKCFYALFGFSSSKLDLILLTLSRPRKDIGRKAISKNSSLVKHQNNFSVNWRFRINTLTNHPLKYFSSSVLLLRIEDASLPIHFFYSFLVHNERKENLLTL